MAFDTLFNKSLFRKDSYKSAIGTTDNNGYSVIRIIPDGKRAGFNEIDSEIVGVIKNNISFSIEANWTDLGNIGSTVLPGGSNIKDFISKAEGVGNALGFSSMTSSFASKLIYQQSGRLSISPQMRIVDWDGTGQPIFSSLLLAAYCLPQKKIGISSIDGQKVIDKSTQIYNDFKAKQHEITQKIMDGIENTSKAVSEGVVESAKFVESVIDETLGMGNGYSKRLVDESVDGLDDLFTLRSSPRPVTIQVGKYFVRDDMVIENVNFEFSKEVTENGPLYVDIDITLKSRKILTDLGDVGLISPTSGKLSRSTIMGSGQNAY